MSTLQQILFKLTTQNSNENYFELFNEFAKSTGWNPSYFISADIEDFANGHIAIEHGLENTAILTFLNKPYDSLN